MTTPKDFNFDAVELTLPYPYMNGEAPDLDKEAELQKMNAITDKLIETEEKYVDDLKSLAEVFSLVTEITCNVFYFRTFSPFFWACSFSYPFLYILSLVYGSTLEINFLRNALEKGIDHFHNALIERSLLT